MSAVLNAPDSEIHEILERGKSAIDKAYKGRQAQVEGLLDLGRAAVELKAAAAETVQGGTTYAELVSQHWGLGAATASQLLSIGEDQKLLSNTKELPASQYSLYLLSTLTDDEFDEGIKEGVVNPEATQGKIKAFKRKLAGPVEKPKPEPNPEPVTDPEDASAYLDRVMSVLPQKVKDRLKGGTDETPTFSEATLLKSRAVVEAAVETLNKTESKKLLTVFAELVAYQNEILEVLVREEVPAAIAEKKRELQEREEAITEREKVAAEGAWTIPEAKKIRSALHTDKYISEKLSPARLKKLNEASALFNRVMKS
ncbi:MAG TPA: hypothetical protein ENJ80_04330 [Gammaproteobacteria bacterium]|nr:hypothetical protein [Gammaproteobacteria bacterium]